MKDLFFLFTSSQLQHVLELKPHPQKQDVQKQAEGKSLEKHETKNTKEENLK